MPRGGVVNARRPGRRPGRSEAESVDDAEHGASIIGAMVVQFDRRPDRVVFFRRTAVVREPIPAEHIGTLLASRMCTRAARFSCTNRARGQLTRGTTNDGVNDPIRTPWGQVQGTKAGSFTPSLVQ